MVKSIAMCLFVVGAAIITGQEAAATKHCPPLPVQVVGPFASCKCAVQNYGTVADAGVTIAVYASNGGFTSCGPSTVPARTGTFCHASIALGTMCGCAVTGEGALTLASLSVTDPATGASQASVECK
jgi:hypothetical protein